MNHRLVKKIGWISAIYLLCVPAARSSVIVQSPGASEIAFEAEGSGTLINGVNVVWENRSGITEASGGGALYAFESGQQNNGEAPQSFAQYELKFSQSGSYTLYYRWRADTLFTAGDAFTGNSIYVPTEFGLPTTPGDQASYASSASNNTNSPESETFNWVSEATNFEVAPSDVSAGTPLIFNMGNRERGFVLDRIVLSTNPALTDLELDNVLNSDTDVVLQDSGTDFVAFEAEGGKANLINGVNVVWENRSNITEASSGGALYAFESGQQNNGEAPQSFAQYKIVFNRSGSYTLYYRWRADTLFTAGDAFTGNSIYVPTGFGLPATPGDQTSYASSASNNTNSPESETFNWISEAFTFDVSPADVSGGTPLILNMGNRERGFVLDRIVMSTNPGLTELDLQLLINSGAGAGQLTAESAAGASTQNRVTLKFSRPVVEGSIQAGDFSIVDTGNNGAALNVSTATISAVDPRVIFLQTDSQIPGHVYTVTINGLTADTGSEIAADSRVSFTAWEIVVGWWKRDVFLNIPGFEIADLLASPNYPDLPDRTEFSSVLQPIAADEYGLRYDGFFIPDQDGRYTFFFTADDQAQFFLSTNDDPANLAQLGETFDSISDGGSLDVFQDALSVVGPSLTAGQMYAMRILHKEEGSAEFLRMAVRHESSSVAPEELPDLGGDMVAAFLNSDLGRVEFSAEPQDVSATVGSRAEFTADVEGGSAASYQWQRNEVNIPEATRKNYITPVLGLGDSGDIYRVVVTVIGVQNFSASAALTVQNGPASNLEPYIGVNMIGGESNGSGAAVLNAPGNLGVLSASDVTGVVLQENWNNIEGNTVDLIPVHDANGNATPVTVSTVGSQQWHTGTEVLSSTSHGALLQGYAGSSMAEGSPPMILTFQNVPQDIYNVYVYSIGFSFQATYEEQISVTGAVAYPVFHVRGQSGSDYITQPDFVRMASQDAANREHGNYVIIPNVSPDASGGLRIEVLNESTSIGQGQGPPLNGVQLVKVSDDVVLDDRINVTVEANGDLTLSWDDVAFDLVASSTVDGTYISTELSSGASVDTSQGVMFYTLRQK